MKRTWNLACGFGVLLGLITGCRGNSGGGEQISSPEPVPAGLSARVVSPRAGTLWYLGDTIPFVAEVMDQSGAPVDANVRWISDLTGDLGVGTSLRRDDLASGRHRVRAVAESRTISASATVDITVSECGPFGPWSSSDFVLPYPPGRAYVVNQSNCSGFGHSGFWKNGYDFIMDIGTDVVAARGGVVGWANDGCDDGNAACTNLITVIHADGTVALYSHLTRGGVLVTSGEGVAQGQLIGRSGNTGKTGGLPHLHFSLHPCNELPGLPGARDCPTMSVNFRNTAPNPHGPQAHTAYRAE